VKNILASQEKLVELEQSHKEMKVQRTPCLVEVDLDRGAFRRGRYGSKEGL
jgi:hypothetical protein